MPLQPDRARTGSDVSTRRRTSTGRRSSADRAGEYKVDVGQDNNDAAPSSPTEENLKPKLSLKRLLGEARPELCLIICATICLFGSAMMNLTIPYFFGRIIDAITGQSATAGNTQAHQEEELTNAVFGLIIVTAVGAVFTFGRGYMFNYAGERVVARLRNKVFHAIMQQEVGFFDATRTGELISRIGSDTSVLKNAVTSNVSMGLRWAATVVGGILYLFIMSWKLTLVMIAIVPFVAIAARFYGVYVRNLSKKTRKALALATEVADESISNIRTVRSFSREPQREEMYAARVADTLKLGMKQALAYGLFGGGIGGVATLSFVAIVWYGGTLVISGEITSGVLTSFLLYSLTIGGALAGLAGLFGDLMKAVGANDRVFQLLDRVPDVPVASGESVSTLKGHVEFKNVEFAYPTRTDQIVLRGCSLTIEPGQVAALVGPSGGGKSTVVNLIERFYDVQKGELLLDGQNIKQLNGSELRKKIGLVRQEPVLFACTIAENICFGAGEHTREEVIHAAKQSNAHDFIMTFPDGYDTMVGERGVRLSGGQKQRVAIARALLMDPKLLLLDEATSALDAESEHLVQEALDRLMANRTVLIIAHRLSTVKDADVVMMLDQGRVQGAGKHHELMQTNELYAKLVQHQLSQPSQTENPPGDVASDDGGEASSAAATAVREVTASDGVGDTRNRTASAASGVE